MKNPRIPVYYHVHYEKHTQSHSEDRAYKLFLF